MDALVPLTVVAFLAATLSGVLGMGGGVSLLGVMTTMLPAPAVVPLHGVAQLCSNFTRVLVFLPHVRWSIFGVYAGPLVLGVWAATCLWQGDKLSGFKLVIGLFILFFLLWRRYKPKLRKPPLWSYAPLGVVAGFLSIFVGATGPFIAPFFLRDDFKNEEVIATKAVCQSFTHLLKLPAFFALGFDYGAWTALLVALIAAVILGTITGRQLLRWLSKERFTLLFQLLLSALALYLIVVGVQAI